MITREHGGLSRLGSATGRRLAGTTLAATVLGVALSGCTSAPTGTATPAATPEVTSATPSASTPVSPTVSPTASTTPSPPETSEPADQVTIDITIAGGQVSPNGAKMNVKVGQQVVLKVTSDEHDEIHAHTADGFTLEVPAGKKVTGSFTLTSPGSYEVEAHHLEKTIVILNAR